MRWSVSSTRSERLRRLGHALAASLLVVLFASPPASAKVEDEAARLELQAAIDDFIQPAYDDFAAAATTAHTDLTALCDTPSAEALDKVRTDFAGLVTAWSRAEIIGFGPITEEGRLERILFWPDRRGIGLKQVQAILADKDETATDPKTLAAKSVASQGLGALEYVLYGTGADALDTPDGAFRCRYGAAIAANLEAMAGDLAKAWNAGAIASDWVNFGPDNTRYRNADEALGELLDVIVHGLEQTRDVRLNGFLGEDAKGDKPKSAIFWRSGQTVAVIGANLQAMRDLFDASRLADQVAPESAWIPQSGDFEFANAQRAVEALAGKPVDAILADPDSRARLDYLRVVTSSLSEIFGDRLAADLDLSVGFSSLDGD